MSFILDALRKSENSRLRQDHPAVFSNRMVAKRQQLPVWGVVLIALLALNLLIVIFLFLRNSSGESAMASLLTESSAPTAVATAPSSAPSALAPALPRGNTPESLVAPAAAAVTPMESARPISRDDLLARGESLPPADLNMHVYDANPQQRFVLLNGQRLREGESSREGLLVERITPEGVVLRSGSNAFAVNLQ
ncbi:MAG: general secretion pathway protein GspB [Gammaproteobacteria bacterium]